MDNLEIAKALFGNSGGSGTGSKSGGQTTTAYGIATSDSENGLVRVNLGGETTSLDDDQTLEVETTFAVFEGDEVIVSLVGADGTGKAPCVIGVVGRGDQQQTEINSVINYVWNDEHGLHVSTQERSVQGANILLDSDSLDIRNGSSNSEADQTVYASFGREVTVGSRASGAVGQYSQVFGNGCVASGDYSFAEGQNNIVSKNYSHVEGTQNVVSGWYSHAEGVQNEIYDDTDPDYSLVPAYSHAEGHGNSITGYACHAEGWVNQIRAGSEGSHVEGSSNILQAKLAHAEGYSNLVSSDYQHVQGKYNVGDSSDTYADIIGNGEYVGGSPQRSNAYNMDWNGNAEFQGEVYVGGCTPNGETPYPVVRYNTSNSQQEYYDGSAWAQVPGGGGGGGSWTELWTNPNPNSNFAAQTVSIDLSSWHLICILAKPQETGATTSAFLAAVGTQNILSVPNIGSTQYFYKRNATISTTGVTFSTGYRNTSGTTGTGYCIPTAIYGLA